jgi:hypothetical protein
MVDGTSLEVPYYWEENEELKFEIAGGVAGIPKTQVASVQEVLTAKEFDPEVLINAPEENLSQNHVKILQELVSNKDLQSKSFEKLDPDESLRVLAMSHSAKGSGRPSEKIHGPLFSFEGDFAELVRDSDGVMLVIRNIINSPVSLKDREFVVTLYDTEGNVLQKKNCELYELDVNRQTMQKLNFRGRLFAAVARIKPDTSIKRYEITAAQKR